MNRGLVIAAVGVLWAIMMAELVKREFLPYLEYQAPPSYAALLRGQKQPRIRVWSIRFGADRIGASESLLEPSGEGPARLRVRTRYDVSAMLPPAMRNQLGGNFHVESWSDSEIDDAGQLAAFRMAMRGPSIQGRLEGRRRDGKLAVRYEYRVPLLGASKGEKEIELPEDMTLMDDSMPFAGGARLNLGKKWQMTTVTFDPQSGLKPQRLYAVVDAKEPWPAEEPRLEAFRVDVKKEPTSAVYQYQLYVDDEGRVLEQRAYARDLQIRYLLEEDRTITPEEAKTWAWSMPGE